MRREQTEQLTMAQDLLDPNPFKDSIYASAGNLVARDVYASKGYALDQWEHAEVLLGTMFSILVRPTGGTIVPFRAFGNLFASGNRRELIIGAAEAYFAILDDGKDEKIHKEAETLHSRIRRHLNLISDASRRRDEIAHGVVMGEEYNQATKTNGFTIWFRRTTHPRKRASLIAFLSSLGP
jgi:hypothetical protein